MTYYEELGIPPSASEEEVRNTYRRLCRMLHPDRYTDATEKELAELQMRRLNDVAVTLTDRICRARYDEQLDEAAAVCAPSAIRFGHRQLSLFVVRLKELRRYPWLIVGVSGLLGIALLIHLAADYGSDARGAASVVSASAAKAVEFTEQRTPASSVGPIAKLPAAPDWPVCGASLGSGANTHAQSSGNPRRGGR